MGDPKGTEVVDDLGEILNQEVVFQEVNQALVEIEIVEIANHQVAVATEEEVGNKLKEELIKIKNGN